MEEVKHIILPNGDQEWRRVDNDVLHRGNDLPAIICTDGDKYWFVTGKHHRENDLPAIIRANGNQLWYFNNKCHRDNDLPAVVYANGDLAWFNNDERHRENDLPAVICVSGVQAWYINGKLHRENNKPAIIGPEKVKYYIHDVEIRDELYNSETHDKFKFISGRKTKAVNCQIQLESDN